MSKKLEITENFAKRLGDAAREFGGRTIERMAKVSSGTVSLIVGGKQKLIGEAVLERLSLAMADLWDKHSKPAPCRNDTPDQTAERGGIIPVENEMACAGELGKADEEVVIDDEPITDEDAWNALDSTYKAGFRVGHLRGKIDAAIELIRRVDGNDDTIARSCCIIADTADILAAMAVPED